MNDLTLTNENINVVANTERLIKNAKHTLIGRDATVSRGKFKGRLGRCTMVSFSWPEGLTVMIQPYRMNSQGEVQREEELLWNHQDARSLWPLEDVEWVEDERKYDS